MKVDLINRIFFLLTFVSLHFTLSAQVFPVQVTGAMNPPRSLDISVYGNERSQDLFFNAVLNDPVEASLQVFPRLSVERRGEIVYQTDPNFQGNPITLNQFDMVMIDGADLQSYLRAENLVGANGSGTGAVEIPAGFMQICLELYGADRVVAVSNKFCISGSFQLNQPPQILTPACGEQLKMPETQNMLFNWQPQHLASSNSPLSVEYEFELVRLPDGYFNANDAFESALKIYQTRTMTPNLLYTQAEPLLETGKLYAWRVRAYSSLHPTSKLFVNEGYSEICTFRMYEDEPFDQRITVVDNPAPVGCSVFSTDYGPITNTEAESVPLAPTDIVKLGYFNMELGPVSGGTSGYSGRGTIAFPMLKTRLEVEFSGLRANTEGRVYEAEKVEALVEQAFRLEAEQLQANTIAASINSDYVNRLKDYFSYGQGQSRQTSVLNLSDPGTHRLPIGLDQPEQPTVAVIGIEFTPRSAYLHLASWDERNIRFAATAVPATPYGMKSKAHLVALEGVGAAGSIEKITESFELSYGSRDSRMNCDCEGYEDLDLESGIQVSPDLIIRADNGQPVVLDLKNKNAAIKTYLGDVKELADFKVNSLPDFVFKPGKGKLDLRSNEKLNIRSNLSEGYSDAEHPAWRGLVLDNIAVQLPEKKRLPGLASTIELKRGRLFIDENQIAYANFAEQNLLTLNKGEMGPWNYSVDQMSLEIIKGKSNGLTLNGKIRTPVFDDPFSYEGSLHENANTQMVLEAKIPAEEMRMGMWKAQFKHAEESSVSATLVKLNSEKSFAPKASFTGNLAIQLSDQEFNQHLLGNKGEVRQGLMDALEVNNLAFDLAELRLSQFKIDPYELPAKRYQVDSILAEQAKIKIGGLDDQITGAKVIHLSEEGQAEQLGLSLTVVHKNNKVNITFWSEMKGRQFAFKGIEAKVLELHCDCDVSVNLLPSKERWGAILDEVIQREHGDLIFERQNQNVGGRSHFGIGTPTANLEQLSYQLLKAQLDANAVSGFPIIDDEKLFIPFLGKNLEVDLKNNQYHGAYREGFTTAGQSNWTDEDWEKLDEAQTGDMVRLPLLIDESNWENFGFETDYNLPDYVRLFISGFHTASKENKLENAELELTLLIKIPDESRSPQPPYDLVVNNKYVAFVTGAIKVGPEKVNFADLYLDQAQDVALNNNVMFLARPNVPSIAPDDLPEGVDFNTLKQNLLELQKLYDANPTDPLVGSFVRLNCKEGLKLFNLQGLYSAQEETIVQRSDLDYSKTAASFGFHLNASNPYPNSDKHPLKEFIAPLKATYLAEDGTEKEWKIATQNAQHILFESGEDFEAYLDFDPNAKAPEINTRAIEELNDYADAYDDQYVGLVFNKIEFEIPDLEQSRESAQKMTRDNMSEDYSLRTSIREEIGSVFFDHATQTFQADYFKTKLVEEKDNARLGSWPYTLDTLSFNIENNLLDDDELLIRGALRIPVFTGDAPENDQLWSESYSRGWVNYGLNVSFNLINERILISGDIGNITDSLYHSAFIDGLGIRVDEGSTIEIYYSESQKRFIARCLLNGRAIYQFKRPSITLPDLAFEGFKVNYEASGLCRTSSGANGIETVDFGTWSLFPLSGVEKELVEKVKNSGSKLGNTLNSAKKNKFTKKLSSLRKLQQSYVGIDINVHDPVFSCFGDEWYLTLGVELNLARDIDNKDLATGSRGAARQKDVKKYGNATQSTINDAKAKEADFKSKKEARDDLSQKIKKLKADVKSLSRTYNSENKKLADLKKDHKDAQKAFTDAQADYTAAHKAWATASDSDKPKKKMEKDNRAKERDLKRNAVNELKTQLDRQEKEVKDKKADRDTKKSELNTAVAEARTAQADFTAAEERFKEVNKKIDKERKSKKNNIKGEFKTAKEAKTGAFSASGSIDIIFNPDPFEFKTVKPNCLAVGGEFGPISFKGGINWLDEVGANTEGVKNIESRWGESIIGMIELSVVGNGFEAKAQFGTKYHATDPKKDYQYWFADLNANFGDGESGGIKLPYGFALRNIGGGFFYNLAKTTPKEERVSQKPQGETDKCQVDGLKAGVSLSGLEYTPSEGGIGGYLRLGMSHKAHIAAEAVVSAEFENGSKFKEFGINLNGWFLYEEYEERLEESKGYLKSEFAVSTEGIEALIGYKFIFEPQPKLRLLSPANTTSALYANVTEEELRREKKPGKQFKLDPDEWNIIHIMANWEEDQYFVHAGSWGVPPELRKNGATPDIAGPASGLKMHTAGMTFATLGSIGIGAYLQAGNVLDDLPPLGYMLPDFPSDKVKLRKLQKPKKGVMAGLRFNTDIGSTFGPLTFRGGGTFGINLQLAKFEKLECNGVPTEISYKNFFSNSYLQGNAYADLFAKLDIHINMFFVERDFNIFDAQAYIGLNFGFPNPSYLKGEFRGEYSLLGGKIHGKWIMPIDEGSLPCPGEDNPLAGIKIHAAAVPENNEKEVDIFTPLQGINNLSRDEVIDFPVYEDPEEKQEVIGRDEYRYKVEKLELKDQDNNIVAVTQQWNGLGDEYTLIPDQNLKPSTNFTFTYRYTWQKRTIPKSRHRDHEYFQKNSSNWTTVKKKDGSTYVEEGTVKFKTGKFPDKVTKGMVEFQAPGFNQRYWHQRYARTEIKIKNNVSIDGLVDNIFLQDKEYTYFAYVEENRPDGTREVHEIPITKVPGTEKIDIFELEHKLVSGGKFKIPYYKKTKSPEVRTIEFPSLSHISFEKGSLCRLRIVRGVKTNLSTGSDPEDLNAAGISSGLAYQNFTKLSEVKLLYEYHFGISQYDDLADKLDDTRIEFQPINPSLSRADWDSPAEPHGLRADHQEGYIPPDDYYSLTTNTNEGFDKFDLNRIRKNTRVTFLDPYGKKYTFEDRMVWAQGGWGSGFGILGTYFGRLNKFKHRTYYSKQEHDFLKARLRLMNEVEDSRLTNIYMENNKNQWRKVEKNIRQGSDGTDWTYQFFSPHKRVPAADLLTSKEIEAKKLSNPVIGKSKQDPLTNTQLFNKEISYDLLFQNVYGRIVSNQLYSLGRIGQNFRNWAIYDAWETKYGKDDIPDEVTTALEKGKLTTSVVHEKKSFIFDSWAKDKHYEVKVNFGDNDEYKWHAYNINYIEGEKPQQAGVVPPELDGESPYVFLMPARDAFRGGEDYVGVSRPYNPNPYLGAYHGRIKIDFPVKYSWGFEDINHTVTSWTTGLMDDRSIPQVSITVKPDRSIAYGPQRPFEVHKYGGQGELKRERGSYFHQNSEVSIRPHGSDMFLHFDDKEAHKGRSTGFVRGQREMIKIIPIDVAAGKYRMELYRGNDWISLYVNDEGDLVYDKRKEDEEYQAYLESIAATSADYEEYELRRQDYQKNKHEKYHFIFTKRTYAVSRPGGPAYTIEHPHTNTTMWGLYAAGDRRSVKFKKIVGSNDYAPGFQLEPYDYRAIMDKTVLENLQKDFQEMMPSYGKSEEKHVQLIAKKKYSPTSTTNHYMQYVALAYMPVPEDSEERLLAIEGKENMSNLYASRWRLMKGEPDFIGHPTFRLKHVLSGKCISVPDRKSGKFKGSIKACSNDDPSQLFVPRFIGKDGDDNLYHIEPANYDRKDGDVDYKPSLNLCSVGGASIPDANVVEIQVENSELKDNPDYNRFWNGFIIKDVEEEDVQVDVYEDYVVQLSKGEFPYNTMELEAHDDGGDYHFVHFGHPAKKIDSPTPSNRMWSFIEMDADYKKAIEANEYRPKAPLFYQIRNREAGKCITSMGKESGRTRHTIQLESCDEKNKAQHWLLASVKDDSGKQRYLLQNRRDMYFKLGKNPSGYKRHSLYLNSDPKWWGHFSLEVMREMSKEASMYFNLATPVKATNK